MPRSDAVYSLHLYPWNQLAWCKDDRRAFTLTTGELMSLLTYCMNILMSLMMLSMVFVMIIHEYGKCERVPEVIK